MANETRDSRVTKATLRMWKRIGEAFRDWAKEVGAREFADAAVDQINETLEVVRRGAQQYSPGKGGSKKKKKKKKASKKKTTKKKKKKKKSSKKKR